MKTLSRIAVVASHELIPDAAIMSRIAAALILIPLSDVYIRANRASEPSSYIEMMTDALVTRFHDFTATKFLPAPYGERAANYNRDYRLIEDVDRVIAFFHPSRIMEGGTGHVVHAALQKRIPVEAWSLGDNGELYNVGSDEGYEVDEENSDWLQTVYLEWAEQQAPETLTPSFPYGSGTTVFPSVWTGTPTIGTAWTGGTTTTLGTASGTVGWTPTWTTTSGSVSISSTTSGTYSSPPLPALSGTLSGSVKLPPLFDGDKITFNVELTEP